jgi:D-tyrosyl-tRNA(Tyr) deacylase
MRALIQRVSRASVRVDDEIVGTCGQGLLVLLGVAPADDEATAGWMAKKLAGLRIFPDEQGRMNLSLLDIGGSVLVISQFTLYGDCRKGRRPSFIQSAPPQLAEPLYERFCELLAEQGPRVSRGVFGATMQVELSNEGPVTLMVESP